MLGLEGARALGRLGLCPHYVNELLINKILGLHFQRFRKYNFTFTKYHPANRYHQYNWHCHFPLGLYPHYNNAFFSLLVYLHRMHYLNTFHFIKFHREIVIKNSLKLFATCPARPRSARIRWPAVLLKLERHRSQRTRAFGIHSKKTLRHTQRGIIRQKKHTHAFGHSMAKTLYHHNPQRNMMKSMSPRKPLKVRSRF